MTVATGNEEQTVTITGAPEGGDFTLTYAGQTTDPIAFDATAAAVKSALVALSNIGANDVDVTGTGPYTVTFKGALRNTNVAALTSSGAGLTGGTSPGVTVATLAGGNPAVTEIAYADISAGGTVASLEILVGQTPPAGALLVDKSDYTA